MGEAFKCVFGFMTKSAYAAIAVWIVSGVLMFLPAEYLPSGVWSMSENIAAWAFMVFVLATTIILFELFRWSSEVVAIVRKRTNAVKDFNRLPLASRAIVFESCNTNRTEFFGDIHCADISALVRHGFADYVGMTYLADDYIADRFELSPLMRELLENRRDELMG